MKTNYGQECPFFYGDYFRGKQLEDCRLLNKPGQTKIWQPELCKNCPVPSIVLANACPNMILSGEVRKVLGKKKVKIIAYCSKTHEMVKEPKVGCGMCHSLPEDLKYSDPS